MDNCSFTLNALGSDGEIMSYPDLAYVTCAKVPMSPPIRHVSELRVNAATCPSLAIVPLTSGLLDTPEDQAFVDDALDLRLPIDTTSVPSLVGSVSRTE
jgi:hypothetical protein